DLKRWVRELGQTRFDVRARPARELVLPRWRFAAGLIAAAGYTGWVLLLDEVELVATFSAVARARAYAVLAMLVGALEAKPIPGLFTVGAVSPDLTQVVFEQRGDREKVPLRWGGRDPALLAEIEAGMAFLDPRSQAWLRIREPRPEALLRTYQRVRELYGLAYEWPPPEEMPSGDRHRIRQHVRRWITRWDLMRLFPDERPEVVTQDLRFDYSERPEMEAAEEDGQAD
ncbi:MAG TPA: BREX system ATP-binding domain-containing protein, partial [Candidatus Dormibacteraeota bacterium]|nr:BREX system ATP-binding domain-containing protein [Candidatus Dormibacteraeota bacterium]